MREALALLAVGGVTLMSVGRAGLCNTSCAAAVTVVVIAARSTQPGFSQRM